MKTRLFFKSHCFLLILIFLFFLIKTFPVFADEKYFIDPGVLIQSNYNSDSVLIDYGFFKISKGYNYYKTTINTATVSEIEENFSSAVKKIMRYINLTRKKNEKEFDIDWQHTIQQQMLIEENEIDKSLDLYFSFNMVPENGSKIKVDGIRLNSYYNDIHFNALYNYESQDIEFGMTDYKINALFGNKVRIEIQTNLTKGSGALVFLMNL